MPNPDPFPSKHQVGPPRLVPVHPVKAASSIRGFSTPPTGGEILVGAGKERDHEDTVDLGDYSATCRAELA